MSEAQSTMLAAATPLQGGRDTVAQLWAWLDEVPDPEIPVVSVVDLGIVRDVAWEEATGSAAVTITPTYSGCPATDVIGQQIEEHLRTHGVDRLSIKVQLSPAWTTDWLTDKAKENLKLYGIAPPTGRAELPTNAMAASLIVLGQGAPQTLLNCPRCGSTRTELLSRFGSTPCKSLHRCLDCLEPFDHFKCH